jgi:hypothetical protein
MPEPLEHVAELTAASRSAGLPPSLKPRRTAEALAEAGQACQPPPGSSPPPRGSRVGDRGEGLRYVQFCNAAFALSQSQPSPPIMVKIIQPEAKSDLEGLSDVLLGSLGLTGAITLAALLLGVALAGVMFWVRSRSA